jgi:hypothetical protein|tara:strand:- start:5 stop:670 length:666 start_codon:yes stop_codon:yes gene_type:complete
MSFDNNNSPEIKNSLLRFFKEEKVTIETKVEIVTSSPEDKDTNPQLKNQEQILHIPREAAVTANAQYINRLVMNGFTPRWYVVFHLNNYRYTPECPEFDGDLQHVKNSILQTVYGSRFRKKPVVGKYKRARMVWSTEFGKTKDRPHINLLLEDFSHPWDAQKSLEILFNIMLPKSARCVWRNSAHIQPIHQPTKDNLIRYICKESNWKNTALDYTLSDTIR